MNRLHLEFPCEGETLVGTLDDASGTAGLLVVSGGNEIRAGTFNGHAGLAARVAAAGHPVFRFDRRGIGDSSGENLGFRGSGADIAAALAAFRAARPDLDRIVAYGNCDAASALMLASGGGCERLVLANPWTFEEDDGAMPPAAIRSRYARKLRDPREWLRFASGQVDLRKLARGLRDAASTAPAPTTLARAMEQGLRAFRGRATILIAELDRTGQAFLSAWDRNDSRVEICAGASHAFVETHAREWLVERILAALEHE